MSQKYNFLIVGSGMFGCVFANLAHRDGYKCLIVEKRSHAFGNCFTESVGGINIHKYGPHIFHTSNDRIWGYVNQFTKFNNFVNRPKVIHNNEIFSFPINLFTLYQLFGVKSPTEAQSYLDSVKLKISNPSNLEEWVLSQVGEKIYYTFIYGYTKKQWNTEPKNLPIDIIKRLPIRLNFDDNYFNDIHQGIPIGGYSAMMSNMIAGIPLILETDYLNNKDYWDSQATTVVYTGPIDKYFDYCHGKLEYRSLRFDIEKHDTESYQGNAVINYTNDNIPFTRIIEHKYFDMVNSTHSLITKEYPADFSETSEPYYPINTTTNNNLYLKYKELASKQNKTIFGGRLGEYRYMDMHQVIASGIKKYETFIQS